MIQQIKTVDGEIYTINQSRHFPGWTPSKIVKDGELYYIYDKDEIRAEVNARHVIATIRQKESGNENCITIHE